MKPRLIPQRDYPANMVAHLSTLATERPGDTALIVVTADGPGNEAIDTRFDYSTLERHVRALAGILQERFRAGERALLLLDNDEHYVISFFACLYAGLVAVPAFPPEGVRERHLARLLAIASDARACCVLTTSGIRPLITEQFASASVLAVDAMNPEEAAEWHFHAPRSEDIAFLQYTSGSTSVPKGVMVSHGNLMANARALEEGMSMSAGDIYLSWLPLYHDMGLIGGLLQPVHRGIPAVLMTPGFFIERPVRWLEAVTRHRATVSGAPDFAYRLCVERVRDVQLRGIDLSSWRIAFSGAEPVRYDTTKAFTERFAAAGFAPGAVYPCYGLAEATLFVTGGARGDGMEAHHFSTEMLAQGDAEVAEQGTPLVACGTAVSHHQVRVVDPATLNFMTDGKVGEIWTSGPSLASGYWRKPQETAEAFIDRGGSRWLRTGDLGFVHAGQLYIAGRRKDLIIVRGQNIYPQDIEQVVETEVEAARKGRIAAFSVDTSEGEGIGIAVEVSRGMQKRATVETLVGALNEAVSASCHEPLSVVVLLNPGALPKTSSGKLQRAACRQGWRERTLDAYAIYEYGLYLSGTGTRTEAALPAASAVELTDETEIALAAIWKAVLHRPITGADDHFFALGGNSLAAVQAAVRIGDHWEIDFTVRGLFENLRLRECAMEIKRILAEGRFRHRAVIRIQPAAGGIREKHSAPLSFGQQRLWFLWQLDPLSTAYHVQHALRLRGILDVEALRASFKGLVNRHAPLRTSFRPGADGSPEQVVQPIQFDITTVDLREIAVPEREARAAEEARRICSAPFNLMQDQLLRVALLQVAEDENILVMAMHHIISDGASMQILIDELSARYLALVQGRIPDFKALSVHYSDFVDWQRRWLDAGEKDRQLAYWQACLGISHPVLLLPADHPRKPLANYQASRHSFDLSPDLVNSLRHVAQKRGATLFMALLAAFQVLLYRYTGQREIRVGVPIANRNRPETAGLIGFFVNTQVLRGEIRGRMTLADVLDQVREAAIEAQAHQDLPFEQLVEALQPERSLSHSPLFQVTINHLLRDGRALQQLPGLTVSDYGLDEQAAQFELTLETVESSNGSVRASLIYAVDLFDPATMERFGHYYVAILQMLSGCSRQPVADIDLLGEADKRRLRDWGVHGSGFAMPELVHCRMERQAKKNPQATAVIFDGIELSYADLNRWANRLAHRLIGLGVKPETRVGIAVERSVEMVVGLLAILKAGGAYVPLDPAYPRERLSYMVEDSRISLLLSQSHVKARIPHSSGSSELEILELDRLNLDNGPDTDPSIALHGDNLAYVIYTSGSTGRPKGVMVAHGPLAMHMSAIVEIYDVRPGDRELSFFSMNFDAAAEQWIAPLCEGGTIVLSSAEELAADNFSSLIKRHEITTLHLPPAYLRLILPSRPDRASAVRVCIAGGEAWFTGDLAATAAAFPHARLVNAYGPTETIITPATWVGISAAGVDGDYVPIGQPVGERNAYVLDTELNLVPPGVAGELYIGGLGLARGYLARPALTGHRFVADPFSQNGGRLYRTGDLVRWRMDGQLEYLGRLDHQVKIRGFRVELGEIEAQLLAQPGVCEAAVIAQESPNGPRLVAYVAPHGGVLLNSALLKTALGTVLPDYMLPGLFVFLDTLPLSPNGKIDRQRLPLPDQLNDQDYEPPASSAETLVSEVWAEILGISRVGLHNNFFDLGGHSLLLIKVQCRLEERMNVRIAIVDLFKYTTVASLAKFLGQERPEHSSPRRQRERAQRQRGSFIQSNRKAGRVH
ncbi:MAG TPA: amino acid adenylation domain-containing protein [Nitrosospira sp.]|nr:amino acid adenylation domain-containing protein [Nitrosospira sp.]